MKETTKKTTMLVQAAIVAALYYLMAGWVFAPVSFGYGQIRVAEALMLLIPLMPAALPGVILGCFLSNLLSPASLGPIDVGFGTMATAVAAILTAYLAKQLKPSMETLSYRNLKFWLLPLPSVLVNAVVVGTYLPYLLEPEYFGLSSVLFAISTVGVGQLISCYGLGLPLMLAFKRVPAMYLGRR